MGKVYCSDITPTPVGRITTIISPGEVHIWMISIARSMVLCDDADQILSVEEKDRASRYYHERDRVRFIISRVALRKTLGGYVEMKPEDIEFAIGANKKPMIAGSEHIQYNVSHSGDKIVIAVSGRPVGIDVEYINEQYNVQDVAETCLSETEQEAIRQQEHSAQDFYRLWTRKEALLKATGKGIDDDIKQTPSLDSVHDTSIFTGEDLYVNTFTPYDSYICSIGTHGKASYVLIDELSAINYLR